MEIITINIDVPGVLVIAMGAIVLIQGLRWLIGIVF